MHINVLIEQLIYTCTYVCMYVAEFNSATKIKETIGIRFWDERTFWHEPKVGIKLL